MDTKKWFESKTIWGSLITLVAMVLGAFGFSIGADDQATLVNIFVTVAGFFGALMAIYGRAKASKGIK